VNPSASSSRILNVVVGAITGAITGGAQYEYFRTQDERHKGPTMAPRSSKTKVSKTNKYFNLHQTVVVSEVDPLD
jgi:hypothetical protein